MTDELKMHPELLNACESLAFDFADSVLETVYERGELTIRVDPSEIYDILLHLKKDCGFNALNDMIGLDNLNAPAASGKRFTVLYLLYRFPDPRRLRVRIDLDEGQVINSIYYIYRSSDWAEREIFDMFGIVFFGHPNMRRIYLPDDFEGHPLRKDFPLAGRF